MSTTKRIEYIDALRGFTMILVVSVHIYSMCFMSGNAKEYDLSYNNFFGLFRMPLFYFISGFVFYKIDRKWDYKVLTKFFSSKIRVQLFSTLFFFFLFNLLFQNIITDSFVDAQKAGYWFTYVLFIYFVLYIGIDKAICCFSRKPAFNDFTIFITFVVGLLLYYSINNGFLLGIFPPKITTLLSINKWQYFIYFSFGCYIHKHYDYLKNYNYKYVKGGILVLFTSISICIFYQNNHDVFIFNNYLLKLSTALLGIMLVMFFFKENESLFSNSTKLGNCLQYIGKHTLDIYFLHYFFLPYNMSFVGVWLANNPNPLLEFCMSAALGIVVIVCCLLVSKIIRLSPTLTYLLLGGKRIQQL